MNLKIAFQGETGAFSEEAAFCYWKENIQAKPCKGFKDVFEAVASKKCDAGIIPIENSETGSIHHNVDYLMQYDLSIVGEIILRIHHNLMVTPGSKLESIRAVYSHPQALDQCSQYLENIPQVQAYSMHDTAGAARWVADQNDPTIAAIASQRASQDYGLKIIGNHIENNHNNFTRFLIIQDKPITSRQKLKTSVVFSTKNVSGALFKALAVFALRDIDLLKIESRPLRKGPWAYWFYLDFEGGMHEEHCQNAIENLREISTFVKVLGSYPKGKTVK